MRSTTALARTASLLLLLALLSLATYWAVRLLAPRPAIAPSVTGNDRNAPSLDPASRLFGSDMPQAATPEAPSAIQVTGVVHSEGRSIAVLSVSGKPGFVAVGERIDNQTLLKSVAVDKVVIEQNGRLIELPTPARGDLKVLTGGAARPAGEAAIAAPAGFQRPASPAAGAPLQSPTSSSASAPSSTSAPSPALAPALSPALSPSLPTNAAGSASAAGAPPLRTGPPGGRTFQSPASGPPSAAPASAAPASPASGPMATGMDGVAMPAAALPPGNVPPNAVYDPNTGNFTSPPPDMGGSSGGTSQPVAPPPLSPALLQQMQQQVTGRMQAEAQGSQSPVNH